MLTKFNYKEHHSIDDPNIVSNLPSKLKDKLQEIEFLDCNTYHEDNNYEQSYSYQFRKCIDDRDKTLNGFKFLEYYIKEKTLKEEEF